MPKQGCIANRETANKKNFMTKFSHLIRFHFFPNITNWHWHKKLFSYFLKGTNVRQSCPNSQWNHRILCTLEDTRICLCTKTLDNLKTSLSSWSNFRVFNHGTLVELKKLIKINQCTKNRDVRTRFGNEWSFRIGSLLLNVKAFTKVRFFSTLISRNRKKVRAKPEKILLKV